MFNGYNEAPNFYNQGLFDSCDHPGLLSGEMSKHTSAPPWEYSPQPYNNLPCYAGQQHLSQLPLIHNQVVSHLEKKDSSLSATSSTHNYSTNSAHQSVVKPTALINCQANCNACYSHSNRVPHNWNPSSESVRYLNHVSLSKELPRYPHGVSNLPTEDARFMGDFSSTFDKLPFFPRDAVENLSHASVPGSANNEFTPSVHDGQLQNTTLSKDIESVKKEKCTKCRGICRSNCKPSKQQNSVKPPNQDQLNVSRENVVRYSGHPSLSSTTWPIASQAQSGMWFQNAQPSFWMSHNNVQMPSADSFSYWGNNEDLSNISLHHGRSGMQTNSRYPVHTGSQESVAAPDKFKGIAAYQDSYKHKVNENKTSGVNHGEILRKELQEPFQNHKVSKQRAQVARSHDMSREFSGRSCNLSSQMQDIAKASLYENSGESSFTSGDDGKLYGTANVANSIRTNTANFNSYPFVNVNNGYNMGLPQPLSQFSSHISYNQTKIDGGSNYVNNMQYPNATAVGSFIPPQIENTHVNNFVPALAKANPTNHHQLPNSCIQYNPNKKSSVNFSVSQQSTSHPVSDIIKYNFTNSGQEPTYSMLQSCNKMSENVTCGKNMQMMSAPDAYAEKVGSKNNPYYFSNLPHSSNSAYPTVGNNVQMKAPFCFDPVDGRKDGGSSNMFCESASDNRSNSNFSYENPQHRNSSSVDISPSAHVSDSSPVQVYSPFMTHSPAGMNRPIKKRKPRVKSAARSEQVHKGPILDVRQYLATWDEESDDVTTMHRLPDVLSADNNSDGLTVLSGPGGRTPNPALGLVPMYNELADDGSECSSVHSENAQSCQQASAESLPEKSAHFVNQSESRVGIVMNNGKHDSIVEDDMRDKSFGNIEQKISPGYPRVQTHSLDHNSSMSPADGQHLVHLQSQAQKYSGLEDEYLPSNETNNESCSTVKNLSEKMSPVAVSLAQSFETATVLLSEDNHETLSSCDLVSDLHLSEVAPVSTSDVSNLHDALSVAVPCAKVKLSQQEECLKSEESNLSSKNQMICPSNNKSGMDDTSLSNENNLQEAGVSTHECEMVNLEDAVCKDVNKGIKSVKQHNVTQPYSGEDDKIQTADGDSSDAASRSSCQVVRGENVLAIATTDGVLNHRESDREVFISTDIQFPDLSYTDSDSSVDTDMQADKGVLSEDMVSQPLSAHEPYSGKHSDPLFIKNFVNEITSNIPSFDGHLSDEKETLCVDKKVEERNPEVESLSSECNMLTPSRSTILSQCSKSENCEDIIDKELQGHRSCESSANLQNCTTVITNLNGHMTDYVGNSFGTKFREAKQINKKSLRDKTSVKRKLSLGQKVKNNMCMNSHFVKRKIKLKTQEAKKCISKLAFKTRIKKCFFKERGKCKQRVKTLIKRQAWFTSTSDKNKCISALSQSKGAGNDDERNKLKDTVMIVKEYKSIERKLKHPSENGTSSAVSDLKVEVKSTRYEENDIAMNLVLESTNQEHFTDSCKRLEKHVLEPAITDSNLSEQGLCETSKTTNEMEALVLNNPASLECDENDRSCESSKKTVDEAVDLRVYNPADTKIYSSNEENKSSLTCDREIGQEVSSSVKIVTSSFTDYVTSSNVPTPKVREVHGCIQSSYCKPNASTNVIHSLWKDCEMWNRNSTCLTKPKPSESKYDPDSGLIYNFGPCVAAEFVRSNTPIQIEALDLCKHNYKEQINEDEEKKEVVAKACVTFSNRILEQEEDPQDDKLESIPAAVENVFDETAGHKYKSTQLGFTEKCCVKVVHFHKSTGVPDGPECEHLKGDVNDVTASFSDDDKCSMKTFSTSDCIHTFKKDKSASYDSISVGKISVHLKQPESPFHIAKKTKECLVANEFKENKTTCKIIYHDSTGSESSGNIINRTDTSVFQNVEFEDGKLKSVESNCSSAVSPFEELNVCKGSNKSELEDDSEHDLGESESTLNVQGQAKSELQLVNSHRTGIISSPSDKDCENVTSADKNQHTLSLDTQNKNIGEQQQSDYSYESRTPSMMEDSNQSESFDEDMSRKESLLHENVKNHNNELQIIEKGNTDKNETVSVLVSNCVSMPENVQGQESICEHLDLEDSKVDDHLTMADKSCSIKATCNLHDTNTHLSEISSTANTQNEVYTESQNQENRCNMEIGTSTSCQDFGLKSLPCNNDQETAEILGKNNAVKAEERGCEQEVFDCGQDSEKLRAEDSNVNKTGNSTSEKLLKCEVVEVQEVSSYKNNTDLNDQCLIQPESAGNISTVQLCTSLDVEDEDCNGSLHCHEKYHENQIIKFTNPEDHKTVSFLCSNSCRSEKSEPDSVYSQTVDVPVKKIESKNHVVPYESDTVKDKDIEIQEQVCSQENEIIPTNIHQIKVAECASADTNCQNQIDGWICQRDSSIQSVNVGYGLEAKRSESIDDRKCSSRSSSALNVQDKEVEFQVSNNMPHTNVTTFTSISDVKKLEPEHNNTAMQEKYMALGVEDQSKVLQAENSEHDQSLCQQHNVKKTGIAVNSDFVTDACENVSSPSNLVGLVDSTTKPVCMYNSHDHKITSLELVKDIVHKISFVCDSNSALKDCGNKFVKFDNWDNDVAPNISVIKSLQNVSLSGCRNMVSTDTEYEDRKLHVETVQEQSVLSEDIISLPERNCINVMKKEVESMFDPRSSEDTGMRSENIATKVPMHRDEKMDVAFAADDTKKSCESTSDLLHLSFKNYQELNKLENSRPTMCSERNVDCEPDTQKQTGVIETFDDGEFVNIVGEENNKVVFLSGEVGVGMVTDKSNGNDQPNTLADNKSGKELDGTVILSKSSDRENYILESNVSLEIIQNTPLSEILHDNATDSATSNLIVAHLERIPDKIKGKSFEVHKDLENEKEKKSSLEHSVALPQSEFSHPAPTLCSKNEGEQGKNTVLSVENVETGMNVNIEKEVIPPSCCQTSAVKTVDVSPEEVSVKNIIPLNLDGKNDENLNHVDKIMAAKQDLQMDLHNLTGADEDAINSKQMADHYIPRCTTNEVGESSEQKELFNTEPIKEINDGDLCGEVSASPCASKDNCGEYLEEETFQALSPCHDEVVEGQLIIIQNNCKDGITHTINIASDAVGVNSVCLETLKRVDNNGESSTWPVLVESDETTQIFIAVAEGSTDDEATESEMPCLEAETPLLKSPEMPYLEAMTKHFQENESSDQDFEMPVLDVSTVKDDTDGANMPSDAEAETGSHIVMPELDNCVITSSEDTEALALQKIKENGSEVVLKTSDSMYDQKEVNLLEADEPISFRENILSSSEVGYIFPALLSENIEPSFHDAPHIIPDDSVSNWPYLEEEVPSELAPVPESTIPLSEAPRDTTILSCSPNSNFSGACQLTSITRNKFRAKGWSNRRPLYYSRSDRHKTLIRQKGYSSWSRICARSKIEKSKAFKVNKNKRYKMSQGWPYFGKNPVRYMENKTKDDQKNCGNNVLAEGVDCHRKIEVRLAQKCEQEGGIKTWCVVGSSKVNNNHRWPVIEENNNVMTTSNDPCKNEDKVPIVLVKRLVLKKSSCDDEGTQEYTVKSAENEDISSVTNKDKDLEETNHSVIPVHHNKTIETSLTERLVHSSFDISKETSAHEDVTSLTCTVCDSNAPTLSSAEYCRKHSPKHLIGSSDHMSVDEHQVSTHHVPRVIIKRTGPGSAKYQSFLRTSPGGSQWQPVVQLLRSKVLDNLAKNVLQVGPVKKFISLSNFRLVLRKRSNITPESVVESDSKQAQVISEPSKALDEEDLCEECESVSMLTEFEKENTVKNTSSCKYVVLENAKDTLLTFQRQKNESEAEDQSEQSGGKLNNYNESFSAEVINAKAKEIVSSTEISDNELPTNRNRDRKCKAVFTYMESSSEDSQENTEMLCPVVRISRKRLSENEDKSEICDELSNKRPFIGGEMEASSAETIVPLISGKRKHSVSESTESSRKKSNLSRHSSSSSSSSSSVDDLRSFGCSAGGLDDIARVTFKERGQRRPRSLRCKNVSAVTIEEQGPDACRVCDYVFVDEADKADHVKHHPYHCQRCHLAFQSKMDFRNHLSTIHPRTKEQHHCLLCERTFPTAARHKVHLTGRQHCYLEMTQRRTIHTLFKLFTSEFCPALPPPTREELAGLSWFPSEPGTIHFYHQATPLQLAVQDLIWRRRQSSGSSPEPVPDGLQGR